MEDAFIGSLIGQAVGDALGFVIEGYGPDVANEYIINIIKPGVKPTMLRLPQFNFGQYSDDTQLARETLISYIQNDGNINPDHYACRIEMLFQPKAYRVVGYGEQTAAGAINIRNGIHHTMSGKSDRYINSKGNGGAMRSVPIGLLYHKKYDQSIIEIAKTMSAITHASERAMDGSVIIALAAKYALLTRDQPFQAYMFLSYVSQGISKSFANEVQSINALLSQTAKDASSKIIQIGLDAGDRSWGNCISCGVTMTVLWSLYSVCKFPDNFKDSIACAVLPGGDVDTTAAIVGGILGARLGIKKIPSIWANEVNDINEWKYEELVELAKRACHLCA